MSTGVSVRMATMWMRMRRTEGIAQESVKIGLYISDL